MSKRTKGADLSFEMTSACSVENGLRTDCRGDWQHQQGQEGGYCNNPGDTDKGGSREYGEKCSNLGYILKMSMQILLVDICE